MSPSTSWILNLLCVNPYSLMAAFIESSAKVGFDGALLWLGQMCYGTDLSLGVILVQAALVCEPELLLSLLATHIPSSSWYWKRRSVVRTALLRVPYHISTPCCFQHQQWAGHGEMGDPEVSGLSQGHTLPIMALLPRCFPGGLRLASEEPTGRCVQPR